MNMIMNIGVISHDEVRLGSIIQMAITLERLHRSKPFLIVNYVLKFPLDY